MRIAKTVGALIIVACATNDAPIPPDSPRGDTTASLAVVDSGAPRFVPRDEANASFREFRARAMEALARKDTAFLFGILAPEIKNTFGGDDGIEGFKRVWTMNEPESPVWTALARVLSMGGQQATDSNFTAPYVYAFWPDSIDAFGHVAVVDDAVVREQPDPAARALGTASNSILRFKDWKGLGQGGVAADSTWAQVQLPGGASGWIRGAEVYSPVSWRAMFIKRGDQWLMIFFVAGD